MTDMKALELVPVASTSIETFTLRQTWDIKNNKHKHEQRKRNIIIVSDVMPCQVA
jgi:hypothetical protein